jgi:hypothetical protein
VESGTQRGRIIFTVAIGAVALVAFLAVGSRFTATQAESTPTPTARPTATPLRADAFHAALAARPGDPSVIVGNTATVSLQFKNTGSAAWSKGSSSEARLGVKDDDLTFSSNGMAVDWPLATRPAVQQEANVAPGENGTFTFQVKGVRPGTFKLALRPVVDGVAWMEDPNLVITISVR